MDKLPIVEFAINSDISSSTGFAPFELNYGYLPTLIGGITPTENAKPGINQAINNLEEAHDAIIESQVRQTLHANKHHRADTPYNVGEQVYLSTDNLNLLRTYENPIRVDARIGTEAENSGRLCMG